MISFSRYHKKANACFVVGFAVCCLLFAVCCLLFAAVVVVVVVVSTEVLVFSRPKPSEVDTRSRSANHKLI